MKARCDRCGGSSYARSFNEDGTTYVARECLRCGFNWEHRAE